THRRIAGIRENAAAAQRSRTEFHAAPEPGHDISTAEMAGHFPAQRLVRFGLHHSAVVACPKQPRDLIVAKLGSPQWHRVRWSFESWIFLPLCPKCRAQSRSVIAR